MEEQQGGGGELSADLRRASGEGEANVEGAEVAGNLLVMLVLVLVVEVVLLLVVAPW